MTAGAPRPENWRVAISGRGVVDRAGGRKRAMNKAQWWIRRRRGRSITVYHQLTGECFEWRGTTWVPIVERNAGKAGAS